jgi:hypothetical protein
MSSKPSHSLTSLVKRLAIDPAFRRQIEFKSALRAPSIATPDRTDRRNILKSENAFSSAAFGSAAFGSAAFGFTSFHTTASVA